MADTGGDQVADEERPEAKVADPLAAVAAPPAETQAQRPGKKVQPKIFVPERPPDDPGPEPADFDDASTPFTRFRSH